MNDNERVSILVPVYNRDQIILNALNSAVNQTYKNIEIIVVDNKSTDNTYEIIKDFAKSHPNVRTYQNKKNIGPVKNWLECLRLASGKYVKFIWSDDWIDIGYIDKTIGYLQDPSIGFVYTSTYIVRNNKKKIYYQLWNEDRVISSALFCNLALIKDKVPVSPGCAIFRKRDVVKNLQVNVENNEYLDFSCYGAGNDLLLFLNTCLDYPKVAFVSSPMSFFLHHEDSLTVTNDLSLYYDYSLLHFAKKSMFQLFINRLKTYFLIRRIKRPYYKKICSSTKGNIDPLFLLFLSAFILIDLFKGLFGSRLHSYSIKILDRLYTKLLTLSVHRFHQKNIATIVIITKV